LTRILSLFLIILASGAVFANEMFVTPPTEYDVRGNDRYGESAYSINAVLDRSGEETKLVELHVTIYEDSISVPQELLSQVVNPHLGGIRVINDAGIFGSYFYIYIPFGDISRCRAARKDKERKSLYISSSDTMDGGELRASIFDPCD